MIQFTNKTYVIGAFYTIERPSVKCDLHKPDYAENIRLYYLQCTIYSVEYKIWKININIPFFAKALINIS